MPYRAKIVLLVVKWKLWELQTKIYFEELWELQTKIYFEEWIEIEIRSSLESDLYTSDIFSQMLLTYKEQLLSY